MNSEKFRPISEARGTLGFMSVDENKKTAVSPKPVEASGKSSLLQFGAFTLDLQRHGLYQGSKRVHLTSKPLETLAVLVEHHGKTVQKQTTA